jgi:hypothetical protein
MTLPRFEQLNRRDVLDLLSGLTSSRNLAAIIGADNVTLQPRRRDLIRMALSLENLSFPVRSACHRLKPLPFFKILDLATVARIFLEDRPVSRLRLSGANRRIHVESYFQ